MHRIASILVCIGCVAQVTFTYPVSYQNNVPTNQCTVAWTPSSGTYTLRIGTTPGAWNVIYRSGLTNNSYTLNLPVATLYGHVFSSTSVGSDVVFSTTAVIPDTSLVVPEFDNDVEAALWATESVHQMRNIEGYAYPWSLLYQDQRQSPPKCSDFSNTLIDLLGQMGLQFNGHPALILQLAFEVNTTLTHTVVTVWNDQQQTWMLLDPLFAFDYRRMSDGAHATKEDMNASVISKNWAAINYVPLDPGSTNYARAYKALDLPEAFLNVPSMNYVTGEWCFNSHTNDATPYLNATNGPARFVFTP